MIQVLLDESQELIADVIDCGPLGEDRAWVCVRLGRRDGKGWMGCWSHDGASLDQADVRDFLFALRAFIDEKLTVGASGAVLSEHYFRHGWETWGPGIPGPLRVLAESPSSVEENPVSIEDFGIGG
ncbi:hypothetical protein [Streptomyces sp. NPDC001480]|uniref:hypothetical protein n=1 Tax=Streptomyces sp. NPDC001480 TaxID=3364577 RepID=UPI0036C3035D